VAEVKEVQEVKEVIRDSGVSITRYSLPATRFGDRTESTE
jgi:hypothetical protein